MKKRILSLVLATLLIAAMAIPASAATISTGRTWNDLIYQTNDTCYPTSYYCVIESEDPSHTLRTNVLGYSYREGQPDECIYDHYGNEDYLVVITSGYFHDVVSFMYANHYIDDTFASQQKVYPY